MWCMRRPRWRLGDRASEPWLTSSIVQSAPWFQRKMPWSYFFTLPPPFFFGACFVVARRGAISILRSQYHQSSSICLCGSHIPRLLCDITSGNSKPALLMIRKPRTILPSACAGPYTPSAFRYRVSNLFALQRTSMAVWQVAFGPAVFAHRFPDHGARSPSCQMIHQQWIRAFALLNVPTVLRDRKVVCCAPRAAPVMFEVIAYSSRDPCNKVERLSFRLFAYDVSIVRR